MKKNLSFVVLFLLLFNFSTYSVDSRSFETYNVDINTIIMNKGYINLTKNLYHKFENNFQKFIRELNYNKLDNEEIIFTLIICSFVALTVALIMIENKRQNEIIKKYRREYNFNSNVKYMDAPTNTSPALVNLIMNGENISREIIFSTLFYLCNLGYYTIKKVKYTEKECTNNRFKNDLIFRRDITRNSPRENHLNFIIELFFIYEINDEFSLNNIERALMKKSEARYFSRKLNEWANVVLEDAKELNFFVTIGKKEVITNQVHFEKLKWLSYKECIEGSVNSKHSLIEMNKVDNVLIYGEALGTSKLAIEELVNNIISKNQLQNNPINDVNKSYLYEYYLDYMNNVEYICSIVKSDE